MKALLLATAFGAASIAAQAGTVSVGYDPAAPSSNFGTPGNTNATTAYDVITSQTNTALSVDVRVTGSHAANALSFSNIYLGGDTFVGIEVTNDRAFIPGGDGKYYDLAGTGFMYTVTGTAAGGDLDIGFTLPFSFLETDPLGMGFNTLSDAPGDNFTRVSLSQSFGYSVAGGQASYGDDRLGSFTIPPAAAVPEPSTMALFGVGLLGLGFYARRRA